MTDLTVYAGVAALVTAVVGSLAAAAVNVIKARSEHSAADHDRRLAAAKTAHADTKAEWQELYAQAKADVDRQEERNSALAEAVRDLQARGAECEVRCERFRGRIDHLADLCERAGIKPRPFDPSGTDAHKPLPRETP